MAVVGIRYQNGAGSIQALGAAIHSALTLQGWTIEYANTDAIGTGSASNPAWTKTFASTTSAGIVVYKMPALGVLDRWFLQIDLRFSSVNLEVNILFTTATGVNPSTGILTLPGTTYGVVQTTADTNLNRENWLGTWEHGIIFGWTNPNGPYWHVIGLERRRDFNGSVQNDCVAYQGVMNLNPTGFGSSGGWDNLTRSFTVGERNAQPLAILNGQNGTNINSGRTIATFNQPAGNIGFPMGFYTTSGGLGGMLRLCQLWWNTDSASNSAQDVFVDGAARQYFGHGSISPSGQRLLLAQS